MAERAARSAACEAEHEFNIATMRLELDPMAERAARSAACEAKSGIHFAEQCCSIRLELDPTAERAARSAACEGKHLEFNIIGQRVWTKKIDFEPETVQMPQAVHLEFPLDVRASSAKRWFARWRSAVKRNHCSSLRQNSKPEIPEVAVGSRQRVRRRQGYLFVERGAYIVLIATEEGVDCEWKFVLSRIPRRIMCDVPENE
ncbi:hypothetical protein C8R47DRAFT_1068776 [Mycena vitilis]|nr:hypothetical protein C8R47DRAFT_1068776 [Mycena vitilis]